MQAEARHILVKTEKECTDLKSLLEGGEDFAAMARRHSQCPSAAGGGKLGVFPRGKMVPEFDAVVFSGELNTILGPVKTQFGYHLIEVTDRSS